MRHYILKKIPNTNQSNALILFRLSKNKEKSEIEEKLCWDKVFKCFKYNKNCDLNLVYINHPIEKYLGLSLTTDDDSLDLKVNMYVEKLDLLITKYLNNYSIKICNQDSLLNILNNLIYFQNVPLFLDKEKYSNISTINNEKINIIFCKPIDLDVVLDKYIEYRQQCNTTNITYKFKRLLSNPYIMYSINTNNLKNDLTLQNNNIKEIFEYMNIPNKYIFKVINNNNFNETSNDIILVSNEDITEYILDN